MENPLPTLCCQSYRCFRPTSPGLPRLEHTILQDHILHLRKTALRVRIIRLEPPPKSWCKDHRECTKERHKTSRLRSFNYSDRLSILGLTTLEERRSRGDLISLYKVHHGLLEVNSLASIKYMNSISSHGPASSIRVQKKQVFSPNQIQNHCHHLGNQLVLQTDQNSLINIKNNEKKILSYKKIQCVISNSSF